MWYVVKKLKRYNNLYKKTLEIISICGGAEKEKKEKPEYYNGNGDNFDTIINGNK